jgi:hypothetical protein
VTVRSGVAAHQVACYGFPTRIPFFRVTLSEEKSPSLYSKQLLDHGNDMRHVGLKNNFGVDHFEIRCSLHDQDGHMSKNVHLDSEDKWLCKDNYIVTQQQQGHLKVSLSFEGFSFLILLEEMRKAFVSALH